MAEMNKNFDLKKKFKIWYEYKSIIPDVFRMFRCLSNDLNIFGKIIILPVVLIIIFIPMIVLYSIRLVLSVIYAIIMSIMFLVMKEPPMSFKELLWFGWDGWDTK